MTDRATVQTQVAENDRPASPQSPVVVTVDDVLLLMEQMHAHRIAFVELPGVMRIGLLPDGKSTAPKIEQPAQSPNAEEAMRRMELARRAQAARREEVSAGRRARSTVGRVGGIQVQQGGGLDQLADDLAKAAGAPIAGAHRPPTTIPTSTGPDTGDETSFE
jgi:hypothetical protein